MRVRTALGRITAAALVLAPLLAASPAHAGPVPLPAITDEQGRALILHGLNTAGSAKGRVACPG